MAWARRRFDPQPMTCGLCRQAQRDGFRNDPCPGMDGIETLGSSPVETCPTGEVVRLAPTLGRFKWLLERVWPQLWNGMGGVQPDALRHAFEVYGVPPGQKPVLNDFFNIVIFTAREATDRSRRKGPETRL